jgi:hypothetical protein
MSPGAFEGPKWYPKVVPTAASHLRPVST